MTDAELIRAFYEFAAKNIDDSQPAICDEFYALLDETLERMAPEDLFADRAKGWMQAEAASPDDPQSQVFQLLENALDRRRTELRLRAGLDAG